MRKPSQREWTLLPLIVLLVASGRPSHGFVPGDFDGDGKVTEQDAIQVLKIVLGARPSTRRDRLLLHLFRDSQAGMTLVPEEAAEDDDFKLADTRAVLRSAAGLHPEFDFGPIVLAFAGGGSLQSRDPTCCSTDGPKNRLQLFGPYDLAVAPDDTLYFSEQLANRVRFISPNGFIHTLAGDSAPGFRDGTGPDARFQGPEGLSLLPDGSLVVADAFNHAVREVTRQGVVVTLAGDGHPGCRDGRGRNASFRQPCGVATDPLGNVYVADTFNHRIRKVSPDGWVTTLAGDGRPGFTDGPALTARLRSPTGVLFDPRDGGLFIADSGNNAIRKLTSRGRLVTLAGRTRSGHTDGAGSSAQFFDPYGLDLDERGRVWIADWGNESVRVLLPDGRVETAAGFDGTRGDINGPGRQARMSGLMNVRVGYGIIYLADTDNQRIRVLIP